MKFEKTTFNRIARGVMYPVPKEVTGLAHKGLALVSPKRGHWEILHVSSGLCLTTKGSKAKAKAFVSELFEAFPAIDWTQSERIVYDACMDSGATTWIQEH